MNTMNKHFAVRYLNVASMNEAINLVQKYIDNEKDMCNTTVSRDWHYQVNDSRLNDLVRGEIVLVSNQCNKHFLAVVTGPAPVRNDGTPRKIIGRLMMPKYSDHQNDLCQADVPASL